MVLDDKGFPGALMIGDDNGRRANDVLAALNPIGDAAGHFQPPTDKTRQLGSKIVALLLVDKGGDQTGEKTVKGDSQPKTDVEQNSSQNGHVLVCLVLVAKLM